MKNMTFAALFVALLTTVTLAQAAVTFQFDFISESEYNEYTGDTFLYAPSSLMTFQAGDLSASTGAPNTGNSELVMSSNTVALGQYGWSEGSSAFTIAYDQGGSGNLIASLGLSTVETQPILPHSGFLGRFTDIGTGGSFETVVSNFTLDVGGHILNIPDLVANEDSVYFRITTDQQNFEYAFAGEIDIALESGGANGTAPGLEIGAYNLPQVPEPSSAVLLGLFVISSMFIRRR